MKKKKEFKIGDHYVLEMEDSTFVGTLSWSDKKEFKLMLEFSDKYAYHQRVYFNDVRALTKLEISKYECFRTNQSYSRRRLTVSLASCKG